MGSQVPLVPQTDRMMRQWQVLCSDIGERRAGTAGERQAIAYLLGQFEQLGLAPVRAESFPCTALEDAQVDVALGPGQELVGVPARALAGSPSTPDGAAVEAELVWVEMPEQAERLFLPSLRGKVVVLVGPLPNRADLHRRLVACAPAAVLHADDRLPFEWPKDDGVYPTWVRRHGMPPIAAIPFLHAWRARQAGADRAKVRIAVDARSSTSQNVVAELRGTRPELPVVLLGAHHDTQCHNPGADDNASGVVALLELAARLRQRELLRTVRFVSFGAEEQLSVGAAAYVRKHRQALDEVGVVLNFDSISSPLGHFRLLRAGQARFGRWLMRAFAGAGLDVTESAAPNPFADHFAFSVFGVPAASLLRPNMDGGMRWQHHSEHDHLGNVSVEVLTQVVGAAAKVVGTLAEATRLPFPRGLAPEQETETMRLARDLYGLRAP